MYGIIGKGSAPKSVIEASLNDIGTDNGFLVPWYGKPSVGLEAVYDWMIDNDVDFEIITNGRPVPNVLRDAARAVLESTDIAREIVTTLSAIGNGMALVMWDEVDEDESVRLASLAIDHGLPTLELTNGMVPIIFEGSSPEEAPVPEEAPAPAASVDEEDTSFDRPTLENMPAAVVKRMAKEKGLDAKTREDAISQLMGELVTSDPVADKTVVSVTITFSDGSVVRY